MRKILWVLICLILSSFCLFGQTNKKDFQLEQEDAEGQFSYEFTEDLIGIVGKDKIIKKCDCVTGETNDDAQKIQRGIKFVVYQREDFKIVQILRLIEKATDSKGNDEYNLFLNKLKEKGFITPKDDNSFQCFRITDKTFDQFVTDQRIVKRYKTWRLQIRAGTLLLPIKYRPTLNLDSGRRPFEFTTNVSVGPFVGLRFRLDKYKPIFINIPLFLGFSPVTIDSNNTNPPVTEASSSEFTITGSSGLVFQIKDIQIGLLLGKDFAGGSRGNSWVYNERFWWSFGIGYKFLGEKDK